MKRYIPLLTFFVFMLSAIVVHALDWIVVNQSTIGWNAVVNTAEGKDFQEGDVIKYQVYIVEGSADKTTAIKVGEELEALKYTITFTDEARWLVGVQSIRIPAESTTDIQRSAITWSDTDDAAAVPVPFGFIYFEPPASVEGLKPEN